MFAKFTQFLLSVGELVIIDWLNYFGNMKVLSNDKDHEILELLKWVEVEPDILLECMSMA